MMNRYVFLLLFSLSMIPWLGHAQGPNPKIRALKIEVVTKDMKLSPSQEKQFLPLYNRYSDELMKVYHRRRALSKSDNSLYVVNERQKLDQEALDIKSRYKNDFLKILSPEQLSAMYSGEEKFKAMLIERLKNHR